MEEEIFKRKVLDDVYEEVREDFENTYLKVYGKSEEIKKSEKVEEEFISMLKDKVKDTELQDIILKKYDEVYSRKIGEMCFWNRQYYKFGFISKENIINELKVLSQKLVPIYNEKFLNYMNGEPFFEYFQIQKEKNLWKQEEYKLLISDINALKEMYPNVKKFFDENIFSNFTFQEKETIKEIINLENIRNWLEVKFSFILGLREKEF